MLAVVGSSFAQGFGGGRGMRGGAGMASPATLLQREEVQDELKLTDDQKSKLTDLRSKMQDKMRETFQGLSAGGERPDRTKMQAAMKKVMDEIQKDLDGILTPEQNTRIKELTIQRQGNMAIANEDTAKALGLTDDQKAKVKTLQAKQAEAMTALFEKMRDGELDRDAMRTKMESNQKILAEEMGKILTEEQKTKLKEMGGKPFEFKKDEGGL